MVFVSRLASGLAQPLFVTSPPGDTARLFVVEQKTGLIKIIDSSTGSVSQTPFLRIPSELLLNTGYEQGLLGLAFHPEYADNGRFYINYTANNGASRGGRTKIVEYRVSRDQNVADPSTARDILSFDQPETNHNGGWMAFGPDGFLYISSGDGGGNGYQNGQLDQSFNSQDLTDNLLGKILRIDVNGDAFLQHPTLNYQLPADNPFVGREGDDEIWSYGLRNPWRPSFDRVTGDFYIADVGQSAQEEVNFQPAGVGGQNYGWNRFEGYLPYSPVLTAENLTFPIYAYNHNYGKSITGGYVYRGPAAELQGEYIFGDFGTGKIASFNVSALSGGVTQDEVTQRTAQFAPSPGQGTIDNVSSFGEDAAGNLYVVDYDGEIFRVNPSSPLPLDSIPPTASLKASGISSVPIIPYTFTVSYNDSSPIILSSIDSNDVRVTGPNGYSEPATLVSTTPTSNATSVTATYRIPAPGGTWDIADNGSYNVSLLASAVTDTFGNATTAASLGSFAVSLIRGVSQVTASSLFTKGQNYELALKDYDGNPHGFSNGVPAGVANGYKFQGEADVNRDGLAEGIFTNRESGRWATIGVDPITGAIDFSRHGQGGNTRVVGIYIDPLVAEGEANGGFLLSGEVAPKRFGPFDSQRRFQNDLRIDNLTLKTSGDFDRDGFQEVYWRVNDGTAYLHSIMHADGNIQYANYQNEAQMRDYLTATGNADVIQSVL